MQLISFIRIHFDRMVRLYFYIIIYYRVQFFNVIRIRIIFKCNARNKREKHLIKKGFVKKTHMTKKLIACTILLKKQT